jgi:hypothetical protein
MAFVVLLLFHLLVKKDASGRAQPCIQLEADLSQLPKTEINRCWKRHHRDAEAAETAAMDENGQNKAIRTRSVSRLKNAHYELCTTG